jgi:hypothetical protein
LEDILQLPSASVEESEDEAPSQRERGSTFKLSFWRKMNVSQNIAIAAKWGIERKCTNLNLKLSNILVFENLVKQGLII